MQAIEFTTASEDGVIKIPTDYEEWFSKTVKVILLRDVEVTMSDKSAVNKLQEEQTELYTFFDQFQADLTDYHFDREEAHER